MADTNTIIQVENVDKREVQNKLPNMERLGLKRALDNLKSKIEVCEVTTDASTSIRSMLGM